MAATGSDISDSPVVSDDEEGTSVDENDADEVAENGVGEQDADEQDVDDTSSEEDRNPVGDIPIRWYQGYDHIGYDREGQKIVRGKRRSIAEEMLDQEAWRRVFDERNDEELILTDQELNMVASLRRGRYAGGLSEGETEEVVSWVAAPGPLPQPTEPKRRFTPSKHEAAKVVKIVRAIRSGLIRKTEKPASYSAQYSYDVWKDGENERAGEEKSNSQKARELMRIQAPKEALPGHAESYNPPPEYLPTEEEKAEWEEADPEDRKQNFVPQQFSAMRRVPAYGNFINERFQRCLDLYLATRVRKDKLQIDPDELLPKLPNPDDLKPFPDGLSAFAQLGARVRSLHIHPRGDLVVCGSEDGFVRVLEIPSLKCVQEAKLADEAVVHVEWNPRPLALIFAACAGFSAFVVNAAQAGLGTSANAVASAEAFVAEGEAAPDETSQKVAEWRDSGDGEIELVHRRRTRFVTWHPKGDYFAVVARDTTGSSVVLHRLSRRQSQQPFRNSGSTVQVVRFHPLRPFFFVASRQHVRVYDLVKQVMMKKLVPSVKWISSMSIHPSGDHLIVGSYDCKLCWFDLDLAATPYKVIRNHDEAIRAVSVHPRLPLFADGSDDGSLLVFHGMVYSDLMQNALVVPLKRMSPRAPNVTKTSPVLDLAWHPVLPWLLTSGADDRVYLFTNTS